MPWTAYTFFAILSALFGYGIYRILTGEENPAHTTRLGNVRATPVAVTEPRPNRFALEEDMERVAGKASAMVGSRRRLEKNLLLYVTSKR